MKITVDGAELNLKNKDLKDAEGKPVAAEVDYGTIRQAAHKEGWPVIHWQLGEQQGNLRPGETMVVQEGMAFTTSAGEG